MAPEADPFDLQRFVDAQAPVYEQVLRELQAGRKRSHWSWFIFPQLRGLGSSPMATRYAIGSLAEAQAYLAHPVLGPRLEACVALVNQVEGRSAEAILGPPDDLKFRSCVTLFSQAAPDRRVFQDALDKYFAGAPDPRTLERL
ncbi:hypothetical protein D3C72_950640 [compost metagenome]